MSADRLAEIKARAEAATKGPWVRDMHSPDMGGRSGWHIRGPRKLGPRSMVLNSRMLSSDAEFIEHAREDVPWLLSVVESGLRMIDALTDELMSMATKAESLTAERDALAAQVARVESHHRILTEAHKHVVASRDSRRGLSDHADLCAYATALERCRDQLRAALAGPSGQEADRG